jgi:hypothetical protein
MFLEIWVGVPESGDKPSPDPGSRIRNNLHVGTGMEY